MAHGDRVRLPVLGQYLEEQAQLTAVERFSSKHDELSDAGKKLYSELIPLSKPKAGEQYGFQVDLDRCTGCKACVSACHSMNGLDQDETWRFVGLLHGGTPEAPIQQTVTTACHHCVDPACLKGCPVEAYEKDPVTGIVKHLDDQCIGCQYCTLTCPYEVPQYSAKKGIVRKCDMCSDRLSAGEAPACVQACPNEAISIRLVSKDAVLEDAQTDAFLPGAPSPGITGPTTTYKSSKALPRNTLPADFYAVRPSHQHRPLVVMLVLTQLSAGAFCIDQAISWFFSGPALQARLPLHSIVALGVGLLALSASIFHLGRPLYAFRAVLGLRTSWLSREILAFGAFAQAAVIYAAVIWREPLCAVLHCPQLPDQLAHTLEQSLGGFVAFCGAAGVFCSVMVYCVTLRAFWSFARTGFKFLMTTLVLGIATSLFTSALWGVLSGATLEVASFVPVAALLVKLLMALATLELVYELSIFLHLRDKQQTDLKRSAILLSSDLKKLVAWRGVAYVFGGMILSLVTLVQLADGLGVPVLVCSSLSLVLLLVGALLERSLFFAACSAPRMPGAFG